jgi:hypothetical protein
MDRPERPAVPPALRQAAAVGWRVLVLLVLGWLAVELLVRLQLVVVPVIVALFLTAMLLPPVDWLRDRGWPSAAATAAVLLAAVMGLAGAGYLLAVQVIPQLGQLSSQVSDSVDELQDWLISGPIGLSQAQLLDLLERAQQELQERSDMLVQRALSWTTLLLELVAGVLFAVVLAFFFLKDGPRMVDAAMARVGGDTGRRLRAAGRRAGGPGTPWAATCAGWRSSGWSTAPSSAWPWSCSASPWRSRWPCSRPSGRSSRSSARSPPAPWPPWSPWSARARSRRWWWWV